MTLHDAITNALERAGVDDFSIEERTNIVHLPRRYAANYDRLPVIYNWSYAFDLDRRAEYGKS